MAKLQWDLLVIDEAHEGVDTFKTDQAFSNIKRLFTLHLSGTPFKALANEKFPAEAIFNWTYADECKAKDDWDEDRGLNPYEEMPRLNMFTCRMSDIVMAKVREGVEIDGDTEAYAFDLNEFFRVDRGKFVNDEAIDKWLDALSRQPRYPFSTPELRHELRHTFWLLNRVDAAKKLAEKLRDIQRHPEFADFEIVVAAGDGKTDNDEVIEDEGALRRVRKAIADHPQGTITLSVGQLTTGVSVREWTGVLILSNMKSPAQYMQAAFRAQTPYLYKGSDGQFHRKENAYIFDFDPARTLTNYEEMANGLSADTASGGGDTDTRKQHVRELLNFFPVIGEDEDGEMMELDAEQVMLIPRKIRSQEVVRSGFMSNFLFANISSIYGCSAGIINIINQFDAVSAPKNGMVDAESVEELSGVVDEDSNTRPNQAMVKEVQAALFGPKIYGDKEAELGDLIAHSIEKYSEKKEKQGKSAEEQLIDHVSSQFFDEVVFNDSVKEFMKLRRRLANYFEATSDEDIFNYIPPQKTNQIFTPKKVVRKMVDLLEEENPGCFDDPDKTFADLYMKSGQYITEIVKRLYNSEGMRRTFPDDEERLRHIFKYQVYGLAPTECIYRIALRYILGFDDTIHIAKMNIICVSLIVFRLQKRVRWKHSWIVCLTRKL